jgi:hypothetical protein
VYDWVSFFEPAVNMTLKFFNIPHRFKFKKTGLVATMQYMHYSPFEGQEENWHPKLPVAANINQLFKYNVDSVAMIPLATVNGEREMLNHLEIPTNTLQLMRSQTARRTMDNFEIIKDDLFDTEVEALAQYSAVNSIFSEFGEHVEMTQQQKDQYVCIELHQRKEFQEAMSKVETSTEGFIYWLDARKVGSECIYYKRPNFYCDLGNFNENAKDQVSRKTKLHTEALKMARVAKNAIEGVSKDNNTLLLTPEMSEGENIQKMTRNFKLAAITPTEKRYYETVDTANKIEDIIKENQKIEFEAPFHFLRVPRERSQAEISRDNELAHIAVKGVIMALKTINNKHGSYGDGEIIIRNASKTVGTKLSTNTTCAVIECSSKAEFQCNGCKRFVCDMHGPSHERHDVGHSYKDAASVSQYNVTTTNVASMVLSNVQSSNAPSLESTIALIPTKRAVISKSKKSKLEIIQNSINDSIGISIPVKVKKQKLNQKSSALKDLLPVSDMPNILIPSFMTPPITHSTQQLVDSQTKELDPRIAAASKEILKAVEAGGNANDEEAIVSLVKALNYEYFTVEVIIAAAKHFNGSNIEALESLMKKRITKVNLIKAVAHHCF